MARQGLRAGIGATLAAVALMCGACTSSSKTASSPSTPASPTATTQDTAQFCADYAALKTSVQHLAGLNVFAAGTNGLNAAIDDVKQKAAALAGSAGAFRPQVDALSRTIEQLQSTLRNVPSDGLQGALPKISSQIGAVGRAAEALASAVATACR